MARPYPEELEEADWPPLVLLDTPNLPPLDLKHLPVWAGDFARALALATETPPELSASMVLAACVTAVARRLHVEVEPGYCEPCNLWIIVALESGNRKSAVQEKATKPLLEWERDQARELQPKIVAAESARKTDETRIKQLRQRAAQERDPAKAETAKQEIANMEAEAAMQSPPQPPQLWTSEATPEREGDLLADNEECIAWLSSEGGLFDLLQGRYSKGIPNLDLTLKAHAGDPDRVDRRSRPPVHLDYPRLTIGISPQPDLLRGLAAVPGFRGRGLLARFLYLIPPSPLGYRTLKRQPIPPAIRVAYAAGIRAMLEWPPAVDENGEPSQRPHTLTLEPDAHRVWHTFAKDIEARMRPGEDLEHCKDWAGKAPGAAARLAGVLHGIEHAHGTPWKAPIAMETMIAALELMEVFASHSIAALDLMGTDPTIDAARRVWRWIEQHRLRVATVRELFNALRGTFPRVLKLMEALEVLEERGYLVVEKSSQEGPGRPSQYVRVRPALTEGW